jgi:tape measure domain-containing protein
MATQQKTTIVIEGDHSKATDALDKVNKAVDKVKENVKELGKEFDKLEPAVNSIRNAATGLNQSATQVRQATAEFRNLDGTVRSATNSLGSMGRSATSSTSSLGSAGRSATQMATGMQSAVSATDILTRQLNHLNLAVAGSSSALGAFRNLMGTLGISIGAGQLAQYMDAWVNLAARLKLATNNTTELKVAQEAVVNISKESRMSLVDLADLYYKVGSSAKDMGINQGQVIKHVQAVANAILISGSSAESAKAALVQYSQAFASNRFGGDELRSVAEQAPRLFKAIREGLVDVNGQVGVSTAQMKQLAAEGFITAAKMNEAMMNSAAKLKEEAKSMPITIGQAFTILNNELVRFIGSESQTSGAFTAIVNGVLGIANNVETLVRAMVVGTGAWISYKAAIVATTVAEYAGIAAASSRNASITASALARSQTTAAEVANTEAQLANAVAAERIAITQAQRLAASGLMTNAVLANTAAVQANAVAQAEYTAAAAISTGATTRLAIAFDTLTLGMMRNPFVALLVVLGSFATYLYTIRDSLTEVDGKMVSVGAIWQATWEDIGNKIFKAKNYLADLIPDAVVSSWTSGINALNQLLDKTGSYFGGSTNEPSDITKRAMAIDAKDKADAEAKAKKDSQDVEEAKSYTFVDLAAKIAGDTKSLPTITNYNKQLEEVYKKRNDIEKAFVETQNQLQAEKLKAQQKGEKEIAQQRETSIAYNAKLLEESKTALADQEAELLKKITTIKNEASGNTAKRSDFEQAFRENLTKDIDAMINEQASLRGVEAAAVKALIATESRFKQGAVSETGAKTMFQFFDPAAKSVGTTVAEMLKSEALTIEKGTQYFAMMLKQSNGNVDQAIARYHDGTGKIQNKINAAGGKFEMSMVSPEAVAQINDFKIALDVAGSSVTQVGKVMRENYKEQEAAIKKQENAIKAIAKRGSPEEERLVEEKQLVDEYAKTVNADATLIADAYARIADAQQKLKDKKLDPFRDYTATAKELYASLQSGDITQSQFNLDIAKSKGTLANRTSETDVPVERQQDVIAFSKIVKDEEKATTAMKKFNDEMDKSTAAFNSFGNSGKMAFDGILGGISAVAAAASSLGTDLTKLNAMQTDSQKNYDEAMKQVGATEADKANATAKYNKDKMAYEQAMIETEISGARSIAGATSKMFGEKSNARKAFHGIEMGLAVIEMAMSLKKTAVNVAEGASKMFAQLGPWGFAAVAGMLAVMAGLGIAAGSSGKTTDLTAPESKTTGSVLGDNEKASTSIKSITDTLNSIHASEYVELKDMNSNFKNLVQMTTTGTSQAMQERGAFSFSTNAMKSGNTGASEKQFMMGLGTTAISAGLAAAGMGVGLSTTVLAGAINASVALTGAASTVTSALVGTSAALMSGGLMAAAAMGGIGLLIGGVIYGLSKLLGIGKVKYEAVGGGIVSNVQEYVLNGMQQQVTVYDYSKIKRTVKGWFSDDVTYYDVINQVDNPLTKLFSGIYNNVKTTLIQAAIIFNDVNLFNMDIILPKMKLALKSGEKYNAENQKKIEDYLNKASDDMATQAFGKYLSQFQEMGEGMLETVQRLAQQAVVAKVGFERLGSNINLSGLGLISFSDSLAKAFGGLKELQSGLNDLYDTFTSESQKLVDARDKIAKLMTSLNIPTGEGTGVPKTITTDADVLAIVKGLGENANLIGTVLGQLKTMVTSRPDEPDSVVSLFKKFSGSFDKATNEYFKTFSLDQLTTEILKMGLAGSGYSLSGESYAGEATKQISKNWKELVDYAANNGKFLESVANFNAAKLDTTLLDNLKKLGYTLPETVFDVGDLVNTLTVLQSATSDNVKGLSDNTKSIKLVTAANQKAAESTKFIIDFSKSISAWMKNQNATQLGSPQTQLAAAQANFQEQMQLARYGATAEEKRAALSGITGYADTYINAIKTYYASSEEGQKAIDSIMSDIGGLDKMIPVEELQLNKLQEIKDAIDAGNLAMPANLSAANLKLYTDLIAATKAAGEASFLNPSIENQLRYDAFAKIVLMVDKTSKSGKDASFINALVESIGSATGLQSQVDLIITDAKFSASEKERIIANVLATFNEKTLVLNNFEFDVTDAIAKAKAIIVASMGSITIGGGTSGGTAGGTTGGTGGIIRTVDTTSSSAVATESIKQQNDAKSLSEATGSQKLVLEAAISAANKAASDYVIPNHLLAAQEYWAKNGTAAAQARIAALIQQDANNFIDSARNLAAQTMSSTFTMPKFANGGIANEPSIFGEAGAEAAVPLPDGRSIPVKIINPSNDSNINTAETIAELKSQNQKLEVLVNTMMATSKAEREKTQELIDAMNGLRTDTRLKNKA